VNAERKEQRRLTKIYIPLVPVVHLSSRKEGREDTGIPCICASILRNVVDPGGRYDLRSLAFAAIRNDLSETSKIARVTQTPPAHRGAPYVRLPPVGTA
jgi:hypothetical protein